jgi:putative membrane protein
MLPAMNGCCAMTYLWLKAGHMIFVIFWMAGLFMLAALFRLPPGSRAGFARERDLDRP